MDVGWYWTGQGSPHFLQAINANLAELFLHEQLRPGRDTEMTETDDASAYDLGFMNHNREA
jgi:hypothetical protein